MADEKIIFSMVGVSKTFTNQKRVLNNIYLSFFYGAKIGIIGLNGSGKSTLMKIIAGIDKNFDGEVVFSPGYTVGYLEQEPRLDDSKTVREVVEEVLDEKNPVYKDVSDVPEYWRPTAEAMLAAGAINGGTPAEECATDVNIRKETLKAAVVAVMYHNAREKAGQEQA